MPDPARAHHSDKKAALFKTIEAGRGIAALLVVLYHASTTFRAAKYWHTRLFGGIFDIGYIGVEFFFVLSGFIILQVHADDIGKPRQLRRYALKRFVRIYPVYWIVLAVIIILSMIIGGLRYPLTLSLIAQSFSLIGPDEARVPLTAAWTLFHEIVFYIIFGVCIINVRVGLLIITIWLLLVAGNIVGIYPEWMPAYICAPVNLLFLFGAAAYWVASRDLIPAPIIVAGAGALVFLGTAIEAEYVKRFSETTNTLTLGISAAIGLAAVVTLERRQKVTVSRFLLAAGAASYSIYLVHAPLIAALSKLAMHSGLSGRLPTVLSFSVLVIVPSIIGYAFHRIVEQPLLRTISTRMSLGARAAAVPQKLV